MAPLGSVRDYQQLLIDKAEAEYRKGNDTALLVAPPGAGKTVTFTALVKSIMTIKPSLRVLFLINRVRLVTQLERELVKWGLTDVGVACGSLSRRELGCQFTVASYLSIININPVIPYNLVVFDEYHRFHPLLEDKEHAMHHWWLALKAANPLARRACFTATPFTSRGVIPGITHELSMRDMLARGILVPMKTFAGKAAFSTKGLKTSGGDWAQSDLSKLADNGEKMLAQVSDALERLDVHNRRHVVWQCINISHCEDVAAELRARGESVAVVHSQQADYEQTAELTEFEQGLRRHLVFVSIVAEGYDHPPIDAVVLLRPTKSPVLYVQTLGRAMRASVGKVYSLLLDYGQVVRHCGPVDFPFIRHASAALEHAVSTRQIDSAPAEELPVVECTACGHLQFVTVTAESRCEECHSPLGAQRQAERAGRLEKTARQYDSLYSSVVVIPVTDMKVKWAITADKAHTVTITYNGSFTELHTVGPWSRGGFDKYRAGAMAKLQKRLREFGLKGDTLTEMALSQRFLFRPEFLIASGSQVLETSGSVELKDDARGEGAA